MRNILVLGAGKSSYHLIQYLLDNATSQNWHVTVADASLENVIEKTNNHPSSTAVQFDINNDDQRIFEIGKADIVISLLPPAFHYVAALECLNQNKNLVTASYVSEQMKQLSAEVSKKGLIFLNECGLDPGIDHMSAMEIIDDLKEKGAKITGFKSYTGGLIAPESNDNPWGYKFTWNPKNVILAGQGTARYLKDGNYKYTPYSRLFQETEKIKIDGLDVLDGYANRDSVSYKTIYNLTDIPSLLRGTLRYNGFCGAWNIFVQLGLTDDAYKIENSSSLTYAALVRSLLPVNTGNIKNDLKSFVPNANQDDLDRVFWTGICEEKAIPLINASPADILLHLLSEKWMLQKNDIDLVAMQHIISYQLNQLNYTVKSSLIVKGQNQTATAMSKTVGLPLAIAAKNILNATVNASGVLIPINKDIYNPILKELEKFHISFVNETFSS